jgi:hypothetical protein
VGPSDPAEYRPSAGGPDGLPGTCPKAGVTAATIQNDNPNGLAIFKWFSLTRTSRSVVFAKYGTMMQFWRSCRQTSNEERCASRGSWTNLGVSPSQNTDETEWRAIIDGLPLRSLMAQLGYREDTMVRKLTLVLLVELFLLYAGPTWAMTNQRLHEAVTHDAEHVS